MLLDLEISNTRSNYSNCMLYLGVFFITSSYFIFLFRSGLIHTTSVVELLWFCFSFCIYFEHLFIFLNCERYVNRFDIYRVLKQNKSYKLSKELEDAIIVTNGLMIVTLCFDVILLGCIIFFY